MTGSFFGDILTQWLVESVRALVLFVVFAAVFGVAAWRYGRRQYRAGWRDRGEAIDRHRFRRVVRVEVARRRQRRELAAAETIRLPKQRVGEPS